MSDSEIVIGLLDSLVDEDYERGRRNKAHSRRRILSSESDHRTNSGSRSPEFQTHVDMALGALKLVLGMTNLALGAHK